MLFPYTYVPHQMDKMQQFIDFIFFDVWCKAPAGAPFGLELFDGNPDLRDVMQAFHFSDAYGARFFNGHVERIYGLFAALAPAQIEQFQRWYRDNNDLERVCANDPATQPARYTDIAPLYQDIAKELATFFKELYSPKILGLAALRAKIGDIDAHYQAFVTVNKAGKCPFCGIADLLSEYHERREAYDHYLPQALFPFNSINFHNLVPACHHCNSSYKAVKNPAYTCKDPTQNTQRRKAFYPYASTAYAIELRLNLAHTDITQLEPDHVRIDFGPAEFGQEIDTWKDVYGIDERYKAKLCVENDGRYWFAAAMDEWRELGRPPAEYLRAVALHTQKNPFAECNFLKKPFLEACEKMGMFEARGTMPT